MTTEPELPTLQVVIVTYNSRDHIGACLEALLPQVPNDGSTVTVFDNASSDGTADLIAADWPQIDLVRSDENLGFGRGVNAGADRGSTQFVLLVNPDATLQGGCVEALLDLARRRPEGGLYGGRLHRPDGTVDPSSCFARPTLWSTFCFATGLSAAFSRSRLFNHETMGSWLPDEERDVDVISGCLLLAARGVWRRLGGFDERYFMYSEDVDLGIRAGRLGCRPAVTPEANAVHVMGASSARSDMEVLLFRGKVTLARRQWTGLPRWGAEKLIAVGVWQRARMARLFQSVRARVGGQASRTDASTWAEVWRRRAEWRDGWPPVE
jgi:GT2 family glycosyltransferase